MKYIHKQAQPEKLTIWIENKEQPSYGNLTKNMKKFIRKKLLEDQGYICCYCQKRITGIRANGHIDTEIEHIKPQEDCTDIETVQYDNLLVSCDGNQLKNNSLLREEDRHCNNFRQSKPLDINPLSYDCEEKIYYDFLGGIHAKNNDIYAENTINNLNLSILHRVRKMYIEGLLPNEVIENITDSQLEKMQNYFSKKSDIDGDGVMKYPEYSGVITNLLQQIKCS